MNKQDVDLDAVRAAAKGVVYTKVGSTSNFVTFYDPAAPDGAALASALLLTSERDLTNLEAIFGISPTGTPFSLYVDTGSFGAYHNSCADTGLHLAAFDGSNSDLVRMLMVAEADEVFMADQAKGWNCGDSAGEGLSRVLATLAYPAQLDGFATAESWLNSSRADYVTQSDPTDQNYVSTGCATLFINYLTNQLGYSVSEVVRAGGSRLADTYATLTGKPPSDAFPPFSALLAQFFPAGQTAALGNDNPFPLGTPTRLSR
jgi:hypothetical protein